MSFNIEHAKDHGCTNGYGDRIRILADNLEGWGKSFLVGIRYTRFKHPENTMSYQQDGTCGFSRDDPNMNLINCNV